MAHPDLAPCGWPLTECVYIGVVCVLTAQSKDKTCLDPCETPLRPKSTKKATIAQHTHTLSLSRLLSTGHAATKQRLVELVQQLGSVGLAAGDVRRLLMKEPKLMLANPTNVTSKLLSLQVWRCSPLDGCLVQDRVWLCCSMRMRRGNRGRAGKAARANKTLS